MERAPRILPMKEHFLLKLGGAVVWRNERGPELQGLSCMRADNLFNVRGYLM